VTGSLGLWYSLLRQTWYKQCSVESALSSLSSNAVCRRIADISEDSEVQLVEKARSRHFSINFDGATECSDTGHLIAYVRYVEDEKCKAIRVRGREGP
jgi:hypothetical protein